MADTAGSVRPKKVLINALHAKSGGGITYLCEMLPRLAEQDGLVLTVLLHRDQREQFDFSGAPVAIEIADFKPGRLRELFWEQTRLPSVARRLGADIVFSPANFGPLTGPPSVILFRNALEVGDHDRRPSKILYWLALSAMTRLSGMRAQKIIAVSEYAGSALAGNSTGIRRKISVIHHGVSPNFRPAENPPEKQEKFLLAVGDIYIQKNYRVLIEAFAKVHRAFPELELRIAGAPLDSAYFDRLRDDVDRHGLSDCVRFLGRQDRASLVSLYQQCEIFLFPSLAETFGQPLAEAMACGAPAIASNATAMPEIAGDGALLCNPGDARALAEQIVSLLRDPARREALSRAALHRSNKFSWDRCARETCAVLLDAAKSP